MKEPSNKIFVAPSDNELLNLILDGVQTSGDVVIERGREHFLVSRHVEKISDEARKMLAAGGPGNQRN